MAETLTIIGASVRAAAQSARRAACVPLAGDLFADLDLQTLCTATQVSNYPDDLAQVLQGDQPGGWMYTGALENYPNLIEKGSAVRPLLGNGADVLREVRNPLRVAECLRRHGLSCPAVSISQDGLPLDGTWLQKPLRSAGGAHIERLTPTTAEATSQACYYQKLIEGESCSAVYIAARGEAALLGITRQLLVEGSFRYLGSVGPVHLGALQQSQFTDIGAALAAEFRLVGLFGVDAVINSQDVWPVEINPRYTSSVEVLERASDLRAIALHIAACRDGVVPLWVRSQTERVCGKAIWFADEVLTIDKDLSTALDDVADVPPIGTRIAKHAPVATVLRSGRHVAETENALKAGLAQLQAAVAGVPIE